ncbi:polysaccharide export outer membrane protein [Loktanella ponticola]|uniref:Polysaccharide export outer membrane protein n=1 Tax=Yoonia ponticola TaxID=1524255 RepID=A0A7W9EYU2_9RHOB|nr:polysaccharide export outer membrane protein [Yoonia ponticola]
MRLFGMAVIVLGLAACGSVYRTPDVIAGAGQGTNVRVIPVTAETVVQANRSPFTPTALPAIFSQTAGAGGAIRGTGALPDAPLQPEIAPQSLTLRLPPDAPTQPYQIGVGDVVLLSTPTATGNTVAELSGLLAAQNSRQGYTVQDDGTINIPNVGRIDIAGRSIEDAEARLFQELVRNQIDPNFSLEIAEFNSQRVSIGGSVSNPTVVPVTLVPLYLDEALARAGGIAVSDIDFASVRLYRDGSLFQIPLAQLYANSQLTRTRLQDGDVLFVDSEFELDRAQQYFEQQLTIANVRQSNRQSALQELQLEIGLRRADLQEARQNFQSRIDLGADNREYVYLAGEVGQQGRFPLPYESRAVLADALFENGGIASSTGDVSQVYVLRGSTHPREFGAVTAWQLDLRNAANFTLATQFELRPDDTVFVAQQPVTRWDRALSQIIPQIISIGTNVTN